MVQCLTVECPIAILSANCQLLLHCIEEVKDCRKGNLPGLFLNSLLQRWDWSCLPSNFGYSFLSMVMEHCAISQHGISKLSFLEAGYAVNCHNYIRFLRIAVIPFIHQHHGKGCYWLWMNLASSHYANDTLIFLWQQGICFLPKRANLPCFSIALPCFSR